MHPFEEYINEIPGFPQKGVVFKDISPLLKYKFNKVIDAFDKAIDWDGVEVCMGIESRGFILAAALATKKGLGFVPIRKKGKLPPPVISESYSLEYGEDVLEIHPAEKKTKVVILDDVLATGGTLRTALTLCKKGNYEVHDSAVLIDLKFLHNFEEEGIKVKSILQYE
jgi:adenine phosphoribosyltransferase